jgi:uncharacterized protein (DUF58 family)
MVIAGLALLVGSYTFAVVPLLVPGIGFCLLGVAGPAWVSLAARSARISRRPPPRRVVEGDALELEIELRRGPLGLPGAELAEPLAAAAIRPVRRQTNVRLLVQAPGRGRHRLAPPELRLSDPLGLSRRCRRGEGGGELLVLPRTEPVHWRARARPHAPRGEQAGAMGEPLAAVDIDGLRPYREAAPASRIHWPALAAGHGLLERRLVPDADTLPLVALDPRGEPDAAGLNATVRAAASLTLALARTGGSRVLLPGERRPATVARDGSGWDAVHVRLALVSGGPAALPPALAGAPPGQSLYLVALRPELPAAGPIPAVVVLPIAVSPPAGWVVVLDTCGCRGYRPARAGAGEREPMAARRGGVP